MLEGLFDALLQAVGLRIRSLAQDLKERIRNFVRGRHRVESQEVVDILREAFDAAYVETLAEALSEVTGQRITAREMRGFVVGPVSLSSRLYHQSRQTAALVTRIVADFERYGGDARALALELFEGYGFRQDEVLKPMPRLPKYMDSAALNRDMDALMARIQAGRLKTAPLRAAYLQALEAVLEEQGQDAVDKALEIAVQERYRYFANRIAQTELARAQNRQLARELMDDPQIEVVQIRLSPGHAPDICDLFARADRYGLGPGRYPKALAPLPTYHPFCRCVCTPVIGLSAAQARENPRAAADYLGTLDARTAARVAGSRSLRDAMLTGADPLALVNARRAEGYRVGMLGDAVREEADRSDSE